MKVLLDECVPKRLGALIVGHDVRTVPQMGWSGIRNGQLLALAHAAGIDVLLTVDSNIEHQQNVMTLPLSVIVLHASSNDIDDLAPLAPEVLGALAGLLPRTIIHIRSLA